MEAKCLVLLTMAVMLALANGQESVKPVVKIVKGKKVCDRGWECKGWSQYCCNQTISDYFQTYQFENLFAKRNTPVAHAVGFWDYRSFITAAARYQPHGFGTTGGKLQSGYGVATGGPLAWGLCYNKEMSPSKIYCDDYYKYTYPCTPGVSYHGRGALPIYWYVG
ncbi:Glycoside hydrolase [Theobroma cacao]|nr:Glycoside hydrolase [Theobroma cacao]